jgi:hypothetical protein
VGAVQTEYSLWTRNVELGVLETCRELGVALVAFSPVGRGALAGAAARIRRRSRSSDLRTKMPAFNAANWPHNLALIDGLVGARRRGRSHRGAARARLGAVARCARARDPGHDNCSTLATTTPRPACPVPPDDARPRDALINEGTVADTATTTTIKPRSTPRSSTGMNAALLPIAMSGYRRRGALTIANAHDKDTIEIAPVPMMIDDMRGGTNSLDVKAAWSRSLRARSPILPTPSRSRMIHVPEMRRC